MAKSSTGSHIVHLRLVCLAPPPEAADAATEFGLQDRRQALHVGQAQDDGAILYEIAVPVDRQGESNALRFLSPFVHGTPAAPFLYLSLQRLQPLPPTWVKRLKIPLSGLTWDQLAVAPESLVFTARIAGSGSGTVPLLDGGWIRGAL